MIGMDFTKHLEDEHGKGSQQSIESIAALLQGNISDLDIIPDILILTSLYLLSQLEVAFGFNKTILLSESQGTPDVYAPTYANIVSLYSFQSCTSLTHYFLLVKMRELETFIASNPNSDYFFVCASIIASSICI